MNRPRLSPREKPWPEPIAKILETYPQGAEGPIGLFRTLAHSERALRKVGGAGLLDRGSPIEKRHREILILRTSFRRGTAYEWGIHVIAFAKWAGLTGAQVNDTCVELPDLSLWTPQDLLLMRVADALCASSDLDDVLWNELRAAFSTEVILEILMLVGFYCMIANFNNVLRILPEPGTPEFGQANL